LNEAQERVQRLLKLYPDDYPLNQSQVNLLLKQNRPGDAEKVLDALVKNRPNDPDIWYQVAETRGLSKNIIGLHQARAEYFALVGDFDQAIQQLDLAKRRASNNFQLASRIDARQKIFIEEQQMIKKMLR
jgi:beta-barrel assembly-enhancing protease